MLSRKLGYLIEEGVSPEVGGAERQQDILRTALRARGHRVSILTDAALEGALDSEEELLFPRIPNRSGVKRAVIDPLPVVRAIAEIDPDVVLVRGHQFYTVVTMLASAFVGTPYLYWVSNDKHLVPRGRSPWLIHRLFIRAVDRARGTIAQTTRQRQQLRKRYGIDATVIPNCYEVPPTDRSPPHEAREYLLWVGRLNPAKKPRTFLDLAKRLPEIACVMIGPQSGSDTYHRDIVESIREVPNVRYEGYVPPSEIDSYYRSAIALVNTSTWEGFPNTFLEAWRFHTPVLSLTHDIEGHLSEGVGGRLSGSVTQLQADAIELASSQPAWESTAAGARQLVETEYSVTSAVDTFEAMLSDVLS